MTVSAVPQVIDALVAAAQSALPDIRVEDGWGVSASPADYLLIGVDDPDKPYAATSAQTRQDWATTGAQAQRAEDGEITCAALSWSGDVDQKAVRDAVYATAEAVDVILRADYTLGVPELLWAHFGATTQLEQSVSSDGAHALLLFKIRFQARL